MTLLYLNNDATIMFRITNKIDQSLNLISYISVFFLLI